MTVSSTFVGSILTRRNELFSFLCPSLRRVFSSARKCLNTRYTKPIPRIGIERTVRTA